MLTTNTQFEAELKKRISEEVERLRDIIEDGTSVESFDQYKNIVGQLRALRRTVNEFFDDANTAISKR